MAFAATARKPAMSATLLLLLLLLVVFNLLVFIPSTPAATIPAVTPRNETCMTRWLREATIDGSFTSTDVQQVERVVKKLNPALDEATIKHTDRDILDFVLSGNRQAVDFLYRCLGNHGDAECRRSSPCQHAGRCMYTSGHGNGGLPVSGYRCVCASGFAGEYCQRAASQCSSSPCDHGGTCEETGDAYTCQCSPFFTGRHCETRWLSSQVLSNMTSTLSKLSRATERLQEKSERSAQRASDEISAFLTRIQDRVDAMDENFQDLQNNMSRVLQTEGQQCNRFSLGYKYQAVHNANRGNFEQISSMTFNKKQQQSLLRITFSSNIGVKGRNKGARWFVRFDGNECTQPEKLDIFAYRQMSTTLYIPSVLTGVCSATSAGTIGKGHHEISVHVGKRLKVAGAGVRSGYGSLGYFEVVEICPPY
ncbi:uncharacterized protein LOC135826026 [Sycon ciliatum]|uniref:uncharacterized protein LOC135826026 n=1 Tax=Sycon ciliatum TaxID=27933 RepID=UPI0031F6ABEF